MGNHHHENSHVIWVRRCVGVTFSLCIQLTQIQAQKKEKSRLLLWEIVGILRAVHTPLPSDQPRCFSITARFGGSLKTAGGTGSFFQCSWNLCRANADGCVHWMSRLSPAKSHSASAEETATYSRSGFLPAEASVMGKRERSKSSKSFRHPSGLP